VQRRPPADGAHVLTGGQTVAFYNEPTLR